MAPNLKQLSQLLLPAILMVEVSGGDCAWDAEEGNQGTGLILREDMS